MKRNNKMTAKKILTLTAPLAAALALGACSGMNVKEPPVQYMSCTDLARQIGKYTQVKEDGEIDSIFGTIGSVLSDDKTDQITNGVEGIAGDITAVDARNRLDKLNAAYNRKNCS